MPLHLSVSSTCFVRLAILCDAIDGFLVPVPVVDDLIGVELTSVGPDIRSESREMIELVVIVRIVRVNVVALVRPLLGQPGQLVVPVLNKHGVVQEC